MMQPIEDKKEQKITANNKEGKQVSVQKKEQKISKMEQKTVSTFKKESRLSNFMQAVKSLTNDKKKSNPLFIDEDLEEDEKIVSSPVQAKIEAKLMQEASDSIIILPPQLKKQVEAMIVQQEHKIQEVLQEIKSDVRVQIIEVAQKGGPLAKYQVYTIKGEDMHGNFYIRRKYTEFQSLRKILTQRWPGSYVPALKNKIEMHNQQQKEKLITKILVNFLYGLSYFKHIYYKQEVQLFLRSPDIDFCEMFDHMPQLRVTDLVSRFQFAFGEQLKEVQRPKQMQILGKFPQNLRKMISKLQTVSAKILELAESYDRYAKNLQRFGDTMRLYEHFSLAEFTQNSREMTVFVKDDDRKVDKMKSIIRENVYYELFGLFFIELSGAKVFLESLIAIDLYDLRKQQLEKQILQNSKSKQDIEGGNITIKAMRTLKQKQQIQKNIEEKLRNLTDQKQAVVELYKMVRKTTLKHILPTFKSIKRNNYCLILAKWIDVIGKQIPQLQAIWNFIKDQSQENMSKVQKIK